MTRPLSAIQDIPYADLDLLGDYLLDCRDAGLRPRTVIEKWVRLTSVEAFLESPLVEASEADVRRWWRSLARRQVSDSTRATYLSHVRAYAAWLTTNDHRADDPTRRIKTPKQPRRLPRDVDPDQVLQIAAGLDAGSPSWWAIQIMIWTGARCAEVAGIQLPGDLIARKDGTVLRLTGKGGHERVVPVPDHLLDPLQDHTGGWLLASRDPAEHLTPEWVGQLVAETLRAGGLDATAHQLRHTNATSLLAATGDVMAVKEHLGHASLTSTQIYARSTGGKVAKAMPSLYKGRPARRRRL